MTVRLENADLRVDVSPSYGGRVVHLIDRQTGRDWMVPGGESPQTGEDAVYGANEAVGWDECFPTVSRWDATGTVWDRNLRDHGDIWGRPMEVLAQSCDCLTLSVETAEYRFERSLRLDGPVLHAGYAVENRTKAPMPFLWALHALLEVRPGDRLVMPGIGRMAAAFVGMNGQRIEMEGMAWPEGDQRLGFPFDVVPEPNGFMAKLYADVPADACAFVGGPDRWLGIQWDGKENGHLGFWLTYGAWPAPGPGSMHHLAIEPTTAPADHLGQAIASGQDHALAPGRRREWSVRLVVSDRAV
ncbi:MAG: hypothetical protein NTX73_15035 [Rhodobacterales bacterium]|nr:hypothetical protein [Rhodobacterales bacterium]